MVKANVILDAFLHKKFYAKYDALVFQKARSGFVEKQYYNLDETNRLLLYPKGSPDYPKNPILKGSERPFNKQTKQLMLTWREGEAFCEPLCNSENFKGELIKSQNDNELINWAFEYKDLVNPFEKFKSNETIILAAIAIMVILVLINIFLTVSIVDNLGIEIFGG